MNTGVGTADFVAKWEIEFERLDSPDSDPRSLLGVWAVLSPGFQDFSFMQHTRDKPYFSFTMQMFFEKDVNIQGYILHRHPWILDMRVRAGTNKTVFFSSAASAIKAMENKGEKAAAMTELMQQEEHTIHWLPGAVPMKRGEAMYVDVNAEHLNQQNRGPLSMTWFFTCDDGTDTIEFIDDVFGTFDFDYDNIKGSDTQGTLEKDKDPGLPSNAHRPQVKQPVGDSSKLFLNSKTMSTTTAPADNGAADSTPILMI
jgi:hypothetical protein